MTAAAQRMLLVRTIDLAGFTGDPDWARTQTGIPLALTRWKTRGPVNWNIAPYSNTTPLGVPVNSLGLLVDAVLLTVFEDARGYEVAKRQVSTYERHGRLTPVEVPLEDRDIHPGDRVIFSILRIRNTGNVPAVRIYAQEELIS